jgi:AraC-like DNA-binding protein
MSEDTLSDVLQTVRLSGAVFFDVVASSPWVAEAPPAATIAPKVMPDAQHVMEYHVITSGNGWATLIDAPDEPVRLEAGSIIMFPQGDRHALSSAPGMRAEPNLVLCDQPTGLSPPFSVEQFGDGREQTQLICGFIGCDTLPFNPVIRCLPRMVHVPEGFTQGGGWLGSLIAAIMKEKRKERVGARSILGRLSELLFIEVVRCNAESVPAGTSGWLAAHADPRMARAIELLHREPARAWTLDELARRAGASRTVLVQHFTRQLGVAPMTYLTNWRMQLAARLLADGGGGLSRVAADVGYESEAAFSRAFKRCTGISPGAWRTRDSGGKRGDAENRAVR